MLLRPHLTDQNFDELVAAAARKKKIELQELLAARAPKPDVFATVTELPETVSAPVAAPVTEDVAPLPLPAPARAAAPHLAPLSPSRYRLELTMSGETFAKLERARALLGHAVPSGDLETLFARAVDALLEKAEKRRLGKTTRAPRKTDARTEAKPDTTDPKAGTVSQETRRAVFARDGEQCTYRDGHGNRCPCRTRLELDHVVPRAAGGTDDVANLRVRCRAHNLLAAEEYFGREHVERQIQRTRRASAARTIERIVDRGVTDAGVRAGRESQTAQSPSSLDVLSRALAHLGFRDAEIRRALVTVRPPDGAAPLPPIEDLIRSALRVLSP